METAGVPRGRVKGGVPHGEFLRMSLRSVKVSADVQRALAASLGDSDPRQHTYFCFLASAGYSEEEALTFFVLHRSQQVYGFEIPLDTVEAVVEILSPPEFADVRAFPFVVIKACWIYAHAPFFLGCDTADGPHSLRSAVLSFVCDYHDRFLIGKEAVLPWAGSRRRGNIKRVLKTTFWDRDEYDPLALMAEVWQMGLAGLEMGIDFHPFNPTRLLPEEISDGRRRQIRAEMTRSGLQVDIHSPIIGPYSPSPDPARGKQLFYDPVLCRRVQFETLDFAMAIGAGSVVFHRVTDNDPHFWAELVERATGSKTRVTMENYYQTDHCVQSSDAFIRFADRIRELLTPDQVREHFGVTVDVGHLNIEGEDPLAGAIAIGKWCREHGVYLRMHATDNYGLLLFSPPAFSADVHGNVSGRGINNALIIGALRSLGLTPTVVAEQISPLTPEDIDTIDGALTSRMPGSYEDIVAKGRVLLQASGLPSFLCQADAEDEVHCFVAGFCGLAKLQEYIVYRTIQDSKHLSVDEAMRISQEFMRMPTRMKRELTSYIDDLLLPVQTETGFVEKSQLDLICQNINGALFWSISNENMSRLFSQTRRFTGGEIICEQHRPGREMYYIKEGMVDVFIDDVCAATLGAQEIFGEISLFYNIPRSATVRVASPIAVVGVLTRSGLEELFRSREPFAYDLVMRLYKVLPGRLRNMNEKYRNAIQTLAMLADSGYSQSPVFAAPEDALQEVQESDVLPTLSRDEALGIFTSVRDYAEGETVCREGDVADGVYFLDSGVLRVTVSGSDESEVPVAILSPGEIFGEIALIEGLPRSATVSVLSPARIRFLEKLEFNRFIESGSPIAFRFMGYICLLLFRRILRLDHTYSEVKRRTAILAETAADVSPAVD